MPAPLDGIIREQRLVQAFFGDDRETRRDQSLSSPGISAPAIESLEGCVLVGVIDQFIRHHIYIRIAALDKVYVGIILAWLDDQGDLIADLVLRLIRLALPTPVFERHGQVGRPTIVIAGHLIHKNYVAQDDRGRWRCGGHCGCGHIRRDGSVGGRQRRQCGHR